MGILAFKIPLWRIKGVGRRLLESHGYDQHLSQLSAWCQDEDDIVAQCLRCDNWLMWSLPSSTDVWPWLVCSALLLSPAGPLAQHPPYPVPVFMVASIALPSL